MKTITQIKQNKKDVLIVLNTNEILKISYEAYLSSYLYEGKELSKEEIHKLQEISSYSKLLEYALSLLRKKFYTESEMKNKLLKKKASLCTSNKIISLLTEQSLISDEMYMNDLFEMYKEKNFGELKIKNELRKKGFKESLIKKLKFNEKEQVLSCKISFEECTKKIKEEDSLKKKQKIFNKLTRLGFTNEVINKVMKIQEEY